jgi:hypothetical protein
MLHCPMWDCDRDSKLGLGLERWVSMVVALNVLGNSFLVVLLDHGGFVEWVVVAI